MERFVSVLLLLGASMVTVEGWAIPGHILLVGGLIAIFRASRNHTLRLVWSLMAVLMFGGVLLWLLEETVLSAYFFLYGAAEWAGYFVFNRIRK